MDLKTFIEKGYFPKELPPPFTAKYFASFYNTKHALLPPVKDSSRGIIYSCPKLRLNRKTLTLTNPQHQKELFKFISGNWKAILKFYKSATISHSNPTLYKGARAVNFKRYGDFVKDCFKKSYHHRYQLVTDISKFYPTAYTHSIPSALHGKDFSKKNKHVSKVRDPVSLLVVLDLINSKLIHKSAFNSAYWRKALHEDFLWDENWIFTYEISVKKWAFKKFDYIDKSPKNLYFKVLKKNLVSFYDPNIQVKTFGDLTKPKTARTEPKERATSIVYKFKY